MKKISYYVFSSSDYDELLDIVYNKDNRVMNNSFDIVFLFMVHDHISSYSDFFDSN